MDLISAPSRTVEDPWEASWTEPETEPETEGSEARQCVVYFAVRHAKEKILANMMSPRSQEGKANMIAGAEV